MAALPAWIDDGGYIGIPFRSHGRDRSGCDCWGLFRLVQSEVFALDLPSFDHNYADASDQAESAALMAGHMTPWRRIDPGQALPGDGILLKMMGSPCHVGIVVEKGWMLHIELGLDSVCERYDTPKWTPRLAGFFRWRGGA